MNLKNTDFFCHISELNRENQSLQYMETKSHYNSPPRYYQSVDGCDSWLDDSFRGSAIQFKMCPGNDMIAIRDDKRFCDVIAPLVEAAGQQRVRLNSKVGTIQPTEYRMFVERDLGSLYNCIYLQNCKC